MEFSNERPYKYKEGTKKISKFSLRNCVNIHRNQHYRKRLLFIQRNNALI